ncbi:zinc ribbon domain-containing protein [uncultured Methanobacterium sp.]|mgnify:CR=1 FL=1|uniref:zinc ribbon domain-containing protein n=1 Tax=uncultured Methanobacterium sp. TaxID=176306 RepID=UPI00280445BF|nr:zinc ribbon domain-containing protein [uncultured Methanobacterium sp.]
MVNNVGAIIYGILLGVVTGIFLGWLGGIMLIWFFSIFMDPVPYQIFIIGIILMGLFGFFLGYQDFEKREEKDLIRKQQANEARKNINGMFCPECGNKNIIEARFCSECGSKFS